MTQAAMRDLQTLFDMGVTGDLSDGQLLDRFVKRREGTIFEAIVRRHGPMVWNVCRRILRDHHDAEDAFQATFLVLARKAASIMPREKLGNWLYGVAYQTARKSRAIRSKRRGREGQVPDMPKPMAAPNNLRDELAESLDREFSRLPEKYRIPIVLCDLEGRSHKEAASQLGWPIGTVSSRLSRARSILAKRLSRRGIPLVAGSLAVLLTQEYASASMPAELIGSTAEAARLFATGEALTAGLVSAQVTPLAEKVLRIMWLSKLKFTTAVLLMGVTLTAIGTSLAYQERPSKEGARQPDQKKNLVAQKDAAFPILPGKSDSSFGGGPNEPRYVRSNDLFFVTSPLRDKFSIYEASTNRASTIRLPGSEEPTPQVTPIRGQNLIPLMLNGPKLTRLYVFSRADWKWYPQDLKEPVAGTLSPTLGQSVVGYEQGRTIYAFSWETKRWSILELPQEAPVKPGLMSVHGNSVVVEYDGHVYEFSSKTGEWKHTDLRVVIDAAIKSAEAEAK